VLAVSLSDAGAVAAIVAGSIALLAFAFGIGRWLWLRATGAAIRDGILIEAYSPPVCNEFREKGRIELDAVGLSIYLSANVPIRCKVEACTVTIARGEGSANDEYVSSLVSPFEAEVFRGRPLNFLREPIKPGSHTLPITVTVEYRVLYKEMRRGGHYRRYQEQTYQMPMPRSSNPDELETVPFTWRFITPRQDASLRTWRHPFAH
jgi:hypothetical protein